MRGVAYGLLILGSLLFLLLPTPANATPYIPEDELNRQLRQRPPSAGPNLQTPQTTDELDELDEYEIVLRMVEALDFIASLQVEEPGANFGGMREGEQDLDIIETDNTQEAVRDWSYYGRLSGDTTRYRDNIDAAWEYILNFPAYDEEGGGNPNYYRVHNCGWGLVATMEYMLTYGDSTYLWYGDSCATYLDTYRLPMQGNDINPLAAGYGAGTLYLYGVWRDNQDWIDAAREIATEVQGWIEENPSRLHAYEAWAMSAGTAMWGVVTALYLDDPVAGEEWIPQYADSMDVYSGPGNWNNSWTVWYGHAWSTIHHILGDQEYLDNSMEVLNFLLEQDEPDRDGGIPATENIYYNDQSWTTAYMVWYTMEPIIAATNSDYDAAIISLDSHDPDWPLVQGDPAQFTLTVGNSGLYALDTVVVSLSIGQFTAGDTVNLAFGQYAEATLEPAWTPDLSGDMTLDFVVSHPQDENPANDTLEVSFEILASADISGSIVDPDSQSGVWSRLDAFLLRGEQDSLYKGIENDPVTGEFTGNLGVGWYRFEMIPYVPPYTPQVIDSLEVTENGVDSLDFHLTPAPLMLVMEDGVGQYEEYFMEALDSLHVDTYVWKVYERGIPDDSILAVRSVIWSCGDLDDHIFAMNNWTEINLFLEDGGTMLLTGQNIQDKWGGFSILRNRFGVDEGVLGIEDTQQYILYSPPDDTVLFGDSLAIVGQGGARNQSEPDEAVPVNNAMPILYYGHTDTVAAVAYEHPEEGYRTVFCGFGVEAINNQPPAGYITRHDFLRRVLAWFGMVEDTLAVTDPGRALLPTEVTLSAWPNPFNPTLRMQVALPERGDVALTVYDVLGREVATWRPQALTPGLHRFTWDASQYASGTYFVQLRTDAGTRVSKVLLLK